MRNAILPLGLLLFLFIFSCKGYKNKNTLFTLLKSSETNITFNNIIKDELDRNYFLYDNFYGGGGVGVGDFNNDGLQDIYFAGNLVSDRLYLNRGNLKFEDITESAGLIDDGGWSSGVAIADVNGDGFESNPDDDHAGSEIVTASSQGAGKTHCALASIPTGAAADNVVSRKIYRTVDGGSVYFFLATIGDNCC